MRYLVDAFPDDMLTLFCNTFACKSIQIWRKAISAHSMNAAMARAEWHKSSGFHPDARWEGQLLAKR